MSGDDLHFPCGILDLRWPYFFLIPRGSKPPHTLRYPMNFSLIHYSAWLTANDYSRYIRFSKGSIARRLSFSRSPFLSLARSSAMMIGRALNGSTTMLNSFYLHYRKQDCSQEWTMQVPELRTREYILFRNRIPHWKVNLKFFSMPDFYRYKIFRDIFIFLLYLVNIIFKILSLSFQFYGNFIEFF